MKGISFPKTVGNYPGRSRRRPSQSPALKSHTKAECKRNPLSHLRMTPSGEFHVRHVGAKVYIESFKSNSGVTGIMQSLTLATVQFTPTFGDKQANFARIEALLRTVQADIIVLPELCTTGYFFQSRAEAAQYAEPSNGQSAAFFRQLARDKNAVVIAGFVENEGDGIYNSAMIAIPEEQEVRIYRKIHLFYKELFCFDVGNTGYFVVYDNKRDIHIGPMICYDWRFPEAARCLMTMGADLIVCPSNLITDAWRLVMPARAIENKVYLAVANRAGTEQGGGEEVLFKGNSAIYGYNGAELAKAGPTDDEALLARICPAETRDKSFNAFNDVAKDRRPEYYGPLVQPTVSASAE